MIYYMCDEFIFKTFKKTSSNFTLSPVKSPRGDEMEEENSIGESSESREIAKETAIFFNNFSIEKTEW